MEGQCYVTASSREIPQGNASRFLGVGLAFCSSVHTRGASAMARSPVDVVKELLGSLTSADAIKSLVAPDATFVSLNYEDKDLKRILPWTGTSKGPQAFIDTFSRVFQFWDSENFEVKELFGSGDNVAVFGSFTFKSKTLGKVVTTPFCIWAKVEDDQIVYWQFMEDSFATAASFKVGGAWQ